MIVSGPSGLRSGSPPPSTAVELVEAVAHDLADPVLVLGDPLGREAALEQRLQAVMLRRVLRDEHAALHLERHDRVGQRRDPSELRAEGLPVHRHRAYVVPAHDRVEACLARELRDVCGPVDRALVAQTLEKLVRRPLHPLRALADDDLVERCFVGALLVFPKRHGGHPNS
jgi:hypothetical protein